MCLRVCVCVCVRARGKSGNFSDPPAPGCTRNLVQSRRRVSECRRKKFRIVCVCASAECLSNWRNRKTLVNGRDSRRGLRRRMRQTARSRESAQVSEQDAGAPLVEPRRVVGGRATEEDDLGDRAVARELDQAHVAVRPRVPCGERQHAHARREAGDRRLARPLLLAAVAVAVGRRALVDLEAFERPARL